MFVASESAGKRIYPLVSELAADGIPVAVTCRVLKLARQPYYRWWAHPISDAELLEAYRANALFVDRHVIPPGCPSRNSATGGPRCRSTAMAWCCPPVR